MANQKVKVYNRSGSDFGIVTATGLGKNIKPDTFELLTEEDIQYIASTSSAFTRGYLFVDEDKAEVLENAGVDPAQNKYYTDEELKKILKGGKRQDFDEFVSQFGIEDIQMRNRIAKMAKEADIPNSRAQFIEDTYFTDLSMIDES